MACGDKYKDLLVVRGHSADEPCGNALGLGEWTCSALDARAWNERADEIMALATEAWNALVTVGGHPSDDAALMEQVNAYWSAHETMERWTILGPVQQDLDDAALLYNRNVVASAVDVCRQGVCVLELLNDRYEAMEGKGSGIKPPPHDPPPPAPGDRIERLVKWTLGGLFVLGLGYVAVQAIKD